MTTKTKKEKVAEESRIKVNKLKLDKETVAELPDSEAKQVKGGISDACNTDTRIKGRSNAGDPICD